MVNFVKQDYAFLVYFDGAQHYLQDGVYSFPVNSLTMVVDESNMATFRKASNNDVVFSQLIDVIQFEGESVTKSNIYDKFSETCTAPVGGSDPATTIASVSIESGGTEMVFENAEGDTIFTADTSVWIADSYVEDAYVSGTTLYLVISTTEGETVVDVELGDLLDDYYNQDEVNALLDDKVDLSAYTEDISNLSGQCVALHTEVTTKLPITRFESAERAIAETFADIYDDIDWLSAHTGTSLVAGDNITISGDVISSNQVIELTQSEYDALSGDVDPSKIYIITDAPAINLNNYTTTATTAALEGKVNTLSGQVTANTASIATKQNQLTAGTGITINNDVISATVDLSNYYTKSEVDNAEQATSAALNEQNLRIIELSGSTSGYADTIDALSDAVDEISGAVETANEITARALVDLDNRKAEVIRMTQQQYQTSSGSVEDNQLVIITDATEVDMSNYYTKAEVDALIGNINQILNQINS